MRQASLNDQFYSQARKRAELAGFANVDDYVANLLTDDLQLDRETYRMRATFIGTSMLEGRARTRHIRLSL
jgi:hypothetical protein